MRRFWWLVATAILTMLACCYGGILIIQSITDYPSVPSDFKETDLIGTWQATYYGASRTKDTIKLKVDGTYQQIFQSPESNYFYQSPWNKWYIEYTSHENPKLHLEGMRYCVGSISLCEATGRGESEMYYDFIDHEVVKLTNEIILRVAGDENNPKAIRLWHLPIDPDEEPVPFNFIGE